MNTRLLLICIMLASLLVPAIASAQDDVTYAPRVESDSAETATDAAGDTAKSTDTDAKSTDTDAIVEDEDKNADDAEEDDKNWGVYAKASFNLGIGAFVKHEKTRKVRSRFAFEFGANYTIPVIDVDIHASSGFSQWMSKAGGTNGKYEFRWADTDVGLSREIWSVDKNVWALDKSEKDFGFSITGDLNFTVPTSKASWTTNLYTTITPSLIMKLKFANFRFGYTVAYSHSFHKYTSPTVDPSEVDVLSRTAGNESLTSDAIAIDGILNEIDLANAFTVGYRFFKNFGLTVGLSFIDSWSYETKSNRERDEFTSQYAKVGRGHSQLSTGSIMLDYSPIKYLTLGLGLSSRQPWKTDDQRTLRFPWYDTVSPNRNYTKLVFSISGQY